MIERDSEERSVAREFRVRPPDSIAIHKMSSKEVASLVEKHAARRVRDFPESARPVGVNRVVLDSRFGGGGSEIGGWAEWTRACCGSRELIEDWEDPLIDMIEREGSVLHAKLGSQGFESQMRIVEFENPEMHR